MPIPRALPWARIFAVARLLVERFDQDIPPRDRKRLTEMLRTSKGNPTALTPHDRQEMLRILRQVDYRRLGRDIAAAAATARLLKR
jgi:hypothetical protein